jgi:putative transposase
MGAETLAQQVGVRPACRALGVSSATLYRRRRPSPGQQQPRPTPARALSQSERDEVLEILSSERFVDRSPAEVVATLLDEGLHVCSERTMYRILAAQASVRERRNQLRHPAYEKPQLIATAPNRVWTWDITKLRGPRSWGWYYLYVLLDLFSRYVVGWLLAERESSALAQRLIEESVEKHQIPPGQLTLHSDRGSPMVALSQAQLLAILGITRSLSRPRVSNDNPFSEAQFKTLKYHPGFPSSFGSLEDAQSFCRRFFQWYNADHRHSGLAMLTPEDVHFGRTEQKLAQRREVLATAYQLHPERYVHGQPVPSPAPAWVAINAPTVSGAEGAMLGVSK